MKLLVIAEQKDGILNRASWEAIGAAQTTGQEVKVAVFGSAAHAAAAAAELKAADVAEVIAAGHAALEVYTADGFTQAVVALVTDESPTHVVFAHTYQTRDYAPRVAARLDRAIATDVIAVKEGPVYVRQMFQGKVNADVVLEGPAPHVVTLQIGSFRIDDLKKGAGAPVRAIEAKVDASRIRQKAEAPFREAKQAVDLTQAERIVSVGRGIKAPEHIELAKQLATAMNAELSASRPICDAGWLPMERQVGSSGQTVSPKMYLALGISGAIQHVVGMKGSKTIVAINKDPEAPIFEIADFGIVGDLFEIVPAIINELK
ncbi:MAG: electron transfer flavoprotein subunit alpha/FixB family protein [Acidobacteria bacterium]|nr:MAG: electron transfer flavoprotein subunit alpha/FixB family protein [Acidobacteriota bacterium]